MFHRNLIVTCVVLYFAIFSVTAHAQLPQIPSGLSYLIASQNLDGTWSISTSHAETTATTISVLETLKLLNQTAGVPYTTGVSWLQAQTPLSVDYIAQRLHALGLTDVSLLIPSAELIKGGWGGDTGYETNPLDTTSALQAIKSASYPDFTIINSALAYLAGSQNSDGGWGFSSGDDSNVYITAIVSATLQQFPQMTTIAIAVNKATTYLLAHQNPDGGFGSSSTVYETALAYVALVAVGQTQGLSLQNAINYLTTTQSANGSWNDDPYSTALALKALYLSENKPSPPPPPPAGGKITGTVIDKITGQKVAGVAVVLDSNQLINTITDASGTFTLADIPAGSQKVNFSLTGYAATSATATVVIDTTASLGNVPMTSSYSTGTIAGIITDSSGKPLTGATIAVSGSWSGSATTGADGVYSFNYVTPGTVTISAAKTGYQTVTAPGSVYARTTLTFSPRMSTAASQLATGTLVGRVVDNYWGVAIGHLPEETGVIVTLSGGISLAVEPEGGGYFSIPNLAPGTYQVIVGMHGFKTQTARIMILPGVTTDLGVIRLEMSLSAMLLTGKITDAATGAAVAGAEVTIQGNNFTGRTDNFGVYAIPDIPNPGQYTVKAGADGYIGKSYTIGAAPWLQTLDFALSPQITKGSISGMVIDAATSQPLAGVKLILASDPNITVTSNSNGAFVLNNIPRGSQQVSLALTGYTPRTLTTVVIAGAISNAGTLPLAVTALPATIKGRVTNAGAAVPFAGVTIRVIGAESLQAITASDGTYNIEGITPGGVTVSATALSNPEFTNARLAGVLEPGGILVFNPALSLMLPGTLDLAAHTDKNVYGIGDTVGITTNLTNRQGEELATLLHVLVISPAGEIVYETDVATTLAADGSVEKNFSFPLTPSAKQGSYTIFTEAHDEAGALLGNANNRFGVIVSQIALTPLLPAAFATGDNAIVFNLVNTGTLPVSSGSITAALKDPDGLIVSTATQNFSLSLGESRTLAATLSIPALKFGVYTLTYVQNDETKTGQAIDIALPNSVTVTALYDDSSHRIRGTANLTVTLRNTGRFNLDTGSTNQTVSVTAAVPDAAYTETKSLAPAPMVGSASGNIMLYQFPLPETMTAGQHGTRITVTLPSGSTTVQTAQLAILESSLSLSPLQTTFTAGETIRPSISNSGGVDTSLQYRLSLYDAKTALITETTNTATVTAGASQSLALAIPTGVVDGNYNLVINYKDMKTGKEATVPNSITINGVKGSIQVQTGKQNYLLTESIAGTSSMTSTGTPLTSGNLHLQVTTGPGVQKTKTWTTQADFRTGGRNGVDTYGVNDWIIPDDDFSGTSIDANRWSIDNQVTLQAGKIFVDSRVNGSGLTSKWQLEGDLDIQVDYDTNISVNNQGPQLLVGSTNFFAIVHNNLWTGDSGDIRVDGKQYYSDNKVYRTAGKLRITRIANTVSTYYWNGSAWDVINQVTSANVSGPCSVSLRVYRYTGYSTGASANFDNLIVNSGRIKTENQTVGSVRLLPLNDNFDDGVLNEDRWGIYGSLKSTEGPGVLHLQSSSGATENGVFHNVSLLGDFQANVKYSNFAVTPAGVDLGRFVFSAGSIGGGDSSFYVNRVSANTTRAGGQMVTGLSSLYGVYQMGADFSYPSSSGILRLVRTQNQGSDEYWNGTAWQSVHTRTGYSLPIRITLYTYTQQSMPTTKVDIDSFSTSKGTYAENGNISFKFDSTVSNTKWSKLLYSATQPLGTSIKFRTRTADAEAGLATAIWSDYLTVSGSVVSSPAARWIEVESTLATTDTNVTPLLHDISVTYESNPGEVLWQTNVPTNLAQGAASSLNHTIGTLGVTGKFYLEGTLMSSTGQTVASASYPFYVEQGSIQISLAPDKKIYRPGEIVTITGEVKNLSSIAATGLTAKVQGTGVTTSYTETFDLPANSSHPFSFTTTAGSNGIYQLTGTVTQNSAQLAVITDQYEVASPALTATLTAPDTVGNVPFTISVSLNNTGKVSATMNVHVVDDSGNVIGDQAVTLAAGESRILQYTRQITAAAAFTAVLSGDLNQTLTKMVVYAVIATDSSISGKIVTDKASYNPNEPVTLTTTISAASLKENLSSLVTVSNSQGQGVYSATAAIPILMQGQSTTNRNFWDTGTYPAGTYLVTLQILDPAGSAISKAACNLVITSPSKPTALLKGKISLDKTSILTGELVTVSYSVTNTGNVDLANIPLSVRTVNITEQTVYDTIADQAALTMGATYSKSGRIDSRNYNAKDYLVVLRATLGGVEETLAGSYFRVEGAPSAPALIGPANGSDVDILTPQLSVSNAADPNDDKLSYEFEIYSDSGLTNLINSGTAQETSGSTAWTAPAPLTENQTCYWRARAFDGRLYGPWMVPATFRVNTVNDPPAAPTVSSPAVGTAVASFTPTLTVNNASDPDSVNLTYNFDVALDPDFTQIVVSTKGVAGGQGTTSWTVPTSLSENGWYYWRAQADDWLVEGPWSSTARFLVNTANDAPSAPTIAMPVNGATVTMLATDVVVANSSDPDSSSLLYYFEADTAPTFDSSGIIRSGGVTEGQGTTLWHLNGLQDNTHYYLRVKSSDGAADSPWSALTGFFANTVNDSPSTPALANPSNGAGVNLFTPALSVHNSTDPDKDILTYEFEVYTDAAMTSQVARSGQVAEAALVTGWVLPVALTENQTYYWRARANDGLLYSGWMPTASFMVNTANDAPGAPQLSAPGDGASLTTLTPTLEVANATDPDSTGLTYDFEVYSNNLLVASASGVPEGASGKTYVTLTTALLDNTSYTWRARAFDGDNYGQWMNMAAFITHIAQAAINAQIEFDPQTLNKKSVGNWVMVKIGLPRGYKASAVDISSIRLEGVIPAEASPISISNDGNTDVLTVKFLRSAVIALLPAGDQVPVHVTGKVGTSLFEGVDIIRVIK